MYHLLRASLPVALITPILASYYYRITPVEDMTLHWNQVGAAGTIIRCTLWIPTFPWTQCSDFLYQQNIQLDYLVKLNPNLASNCYGWTGGESYCVLGSYVPKTSTDGACGSNTSVTCIGSSYGDCCGKNGRCGSTDDYCAIGNCQAGICPGLGYTTDGNCGIDYNSLLCGGPYGKCCSKDGKCGSTDAECGIGKCQSGACAEYPSTTSQAPATSTSSVPLPSPYSPSPDGTCGGLPKYKCTGSKFKYGECCGATGYCGFSEWECSDSLGCQADYGFCDKTVKVVNGKGDPKVVFKDDFKSGELNSRWTQYGGSFSIFGKTFLMGNSTADPDGKLLVNNIALDDVFINATVINLVTSKGDVGFLFRVSDPGTGVGRYSGYYAGIADNFVTLGDADGVFRTELARTQVTIASGKSYHFAVKAVGNNIALFVDDMVVPKLTIQDSRHKSGMCGIHVFGTIGWVTNMMVTQL